MIQNLLKGTNQNSTNTEAPKEETKAQAQPEKQEPVVAKHTEDITPPVDDSFRSFEASNSNRDVSYRRYLTPQLTAELSEFSGLSLRLEEGWGPKKDDNKSKFQLRASRPFVIGVCGGNCAGKMDLVNYIVQSLDSKRCTILKQENFYKPIPEQERVEDYNYDDPDATDWEYMEGGLDALLYHSKPFHTPIYNFKLNKRDMNTQELWPNPIIIVEGLLIFHIEGIRKRLDLKIFLDTDDDIRLSRRIMKGYMQLGRDVDSIVDRYRKFVKPCHEKYVLPSRKFADIIVPNFGAGICEELQFYNDKKNDKEKTNEKKAPALKVNIALELMVAQIKFHLEEMDKIRHFQQKT